MVDIMLDLRNAVWQSNEDVDGRDRIYKPKANDTGYVVKKEWTLSGSQIVAVQGCNTTEVVSNKPRAAQYN